MRNSKNTIYLLTKIVKILEMDGPIMELDLICSRFRAIPTPVICDAMYELGIPEQVLSRHSH